eukprot:TRINITY_DN35768_c0_g1_i1.p2 TRINITY_DN35768_c0_g1~~TRINITY_DN35768_c0_g1_i1.p2  ORF type:complete len:286 (-),score=75.84 TRINITY_DN35768_c0_g1_i1:985-1842(-)
MFKRIFSQARAAGVKGPDARIFVVLALPIVVYKSMFNVESGCRAIKFNKIVGISDTVYEEGTHFLLPWIEKPLNYNVRTSSWSTSSQTGSRDLQTVSLTVRVLSRPNPDSLVRIHRQLGPDYVERVMPSICNETLKAVIAQFNASELLTKRAEVSQQIFTILSNRARQFDIVITDVSITHLGFSKEYREAVEAKQIAEQDAGRARFRTEQAIQEKKSMEILAELEAESARLIGESVGKNPGFLVMRRLEAAKEIAIAMSKSAASIYIPSDTLLLHTVGERQDIPK